MIVYKPAEIIVYICGISFCLTFLTWLGIALFREPKTRRTGEGSKRGLYIYDTKYGRHRWGWWVCVAIMIVSGSQFWNAYTLTYPDTVFDHKVTVNFIDGTSVTHDDILQAHILYSGGGFCSGGIPTRLYLRSRWREQSRVCQLSAIKDYEVVQTGERLTMHGHTVTKDINGNWVSK